MRYEWIEKDITYFSQRNFQEVSADLRSSKMICVLTRSPEISDFVVINLFSPLNHFFSQPRWFLEGRNFSTATRGNYRPEFRSRPIDREQINKEARALFRKHKLAKADPELRWFDELAEIAGLAARRIKSLSEPPLSYYESGRWLNLCIHTKYVDFYQSHVQQLLGQVGQFLFWPAHELTRHRDSFSDINSSDEMRLGGIGVQGELLYDKPEVYLALSNTAIQAIERTLSQLDAGIPFDWTTSPNAIDRGASFSRWPKHWGLRDEMYSSQNRLLSLRAHLIRRLACPIYLSSAQRVMNQDPEICRYDDIMHPYDLLQELRIYTKEMKEKYPVLS